MCVRMRRLRLRNDLYCVGGALNSTHSLAHHIRSIDSMHWQMNAKQEISAKHNNKYYSVYSAIGNIINNSKRKNDYTIISSLYHLSHYNTLI